MKISLHSQSPTGPALYTETFQPTSSESGLVNIEIGKGNAVAENFSTLDWSTGGPYYIEVSIDKAGGANYISMGTSQLLSVPYALYAKTAGNAFSGDYNELKNAPDLS